LADTARNSTPYEKSALREDYVIPLSAPHLSGNEWEYVKECLDTGWISSAGSFVERFESEVASYCGVKHAVAVSSGTAALHLALRAAGVCPDEEGIVSTLAFIAPANAVRYVGAWPVFIDAEPDYLQMDADKLEGFLAKGCHRSKGALVNHQTARRVKALLPVHALGHPCNMDPLVKLANEYGLVIIEDAAEALGTRYKGAPMGAFGNAACLSFNGNKIISTGGGGMVLSNDETVAATAKHLSTQAKDDEVEYVHSAIGYNYRLSNVQAAIGCAQMEKLEDHIAWKRRIAEVYRSHLATVPGIEPMKEAPWAFSTFWLYTVTVDETRFGMDSRALLRKLRETGIESRPLWQPLHLSPAHAGCQSSSCEVSERLWRDCLSLPCSVGLQPETQMRVIEKIASLAS